MFNIYTTRCINAISFLITFFSIIILSNLHENIDQIDFRKTFFYYLLKPNIVKVQMETDGINKSTNDISNNILDNNSNNNFQNNSQNNSENTLKNNSQNSISKENSNENTSDNNLEKTSETKSKTTNQNTWQIVIPAISLEAPIAEGTSKQVMNEFVGHFEETPKTLGNVGLAAHNRGYPVNYFSNLKKLKEGDRIFYSMGSFSKTYIVEKNIIVKDTDWTILENTDDNRLTLITCVENEPTYRRCIQSIEVK